MNTKVAIIVILTALLMAAVTFRHFYPGSFHEPQIQECLADSDCTFDSCCHSTGCIAIENRPNCTGRICTLNCAPDTLDCGQGYCACINNACTPVYENE